jgi:ABC-type transporter Mla subunit MlaD
MMYNVLDELNRNLTKLGNNINNIGDLVEQLDTLNKHLASYTGEFGRLNDNIDSIKVLLDKFNID